jgi:hypothetical protein
VDGQLHDEPSPCPNRYSLEGRFTLDVVNDPSIDPDAHIALYDLSGPWGSLDASFPADPDSGFHAWVDERSREVRSPLPTLRQIWLQIRPASSTLEITAVFDPLPPGPNNHSQHQTEVRPWEQPLFETPFTLTPAPDVP